MSLQNKLRMLFYTIYDHNTEEKEEIESHIIGKADNHLEQEESIIRA